jgi:integrase
MSDTSLLLLDAAGRRRSPATVPGFLAGRAPRNKGMEYPADPPRPEEIILVMRHAGNDRHGLRIRALIAVLWRGGLRISEALALNETDVDERRGSLLIRHGKGDKRRQAGMDQFGFEQLNAWLAHRAVLPPGPLFCVIDGATRGRRWSDTAARGECGRLRCRCWRSLRGCGSLGGRLAWVTPPSAMRMLTSSSPCPNSRLASRGADRRSRPGSRGVAARR